MLVVGSTDLGFIARHSATASGPSFDIRDFGLLSKVIDEFGGLVVTPGVLAETSNLVNSGATDMRLRINGVLRQVIANLSEEPVAGIDAVARPEFKWLWLTDCGLMEASRRTGAPVLTTDAKLYAEMTRQGLECRNFTHLRAESRL